jgi:hypothetical protein
MVAKSSAVRSKGPQKPSRYPIAVGPRYKIWGEQPGYIYNPYQDQYVPDTQGQIAAMQASGALPKDPEAPKEPGLADTVLPVAGAQLANSAGQEIGKGLFGGGGLSNVLGPLTSTVDPATGATSPGLITSSFGSGPTGLFGIGEGGFGGPVLGAAGLFDVIKNKRGGARGVAQGAASGAAAGSYFGPWGTGIGAVLGAGAGLMNRGFSDLEDQKRKEAAAMGYQLQGGDGAWEKNADFATSRDESKLRGEDILDAADWRLKYGDRWGLTDKARQIEIANEAIKRGLIREHNGGIDIDTNGLSDFIKAA